MPYRVIWEENYSQQESNYTLIIKTTNRKRKKYLLENIHISFAIYSNIKCVNVSRLPGKEIIFIKLATYNH